MSKRMAFMLLFCAALLAVSTGTHMDGTTFSCSGSGSGGGTCTGDLCD